MEYTGYTADRVASVLSKVVLGRGRPGIDDDGALVVGRKPRRRNELVCNRIVLATILEPVL